jgi:outer membrane protein assembly factor BamD
LAIAFTGLILSGCAGSGKNADPTADWTAQQFYKNAKNELKSGDYELAVEYFETLESRFPFGSYAEQAQLENGYAYYKYNEYDSAIAAADRFIKLHPTHPNVDYASYLRGLAAFHKKRRATGFYRPARPGIA